MLIKVIERQTNNDGKVVKTVFESKSGIKKEVSVTKTFYMDLTPEQEAKLKENKLYGFERADPLKVSEEELEAGRKRKAQVLKY